MSHYLHNTDNNISSERKKEIADAIKSFLIRKNARQTNNLNDLSDDDLLKAAESPEQFSLFADFFKIPFPSPEKHKFTFIDLFAGIGGFRIALQNLGGKCVYSSEFDAKAQETYLANFGEMPFGDITKQSTKNYIPDNFDILCGGFPCQAFSLAGKRLGFADETRGRLRIKLSFSYWCSPFFNSELDEETGVEEAAGEVVGDGVLLAGDVGDPKVGGDIADAEDVEAVEAEPYVAEVLPET